MRWASTCLTTLAVCAPAFLAIHPASAADLGGSGGYKDGGAPADDWTITGLQVGGILVVQPKYEGGSDYELVGFPYVLPQTAGGGDFFSRFDARGVDDVRFELYRRDGFLIGPLAGYHFGRHENDGDLLRGLGDIDGGIVAGGFVGYRWGDLQFDVAYRHYFDDSDGYQLGFNASIERPISNRLTLTGSVGATYADENYMQTFFGVTSAQASSSNTAGVGLPAFDAGAGFKDVHVQIGLKTDIDEHWSAMASVQYTRLIGDAADSPVVEDENQWMGLIGLSYKFDLAR